ncbi:HNH endonuclease, partial [Glaciihabitans sp. dw_435]|uniref:HNH endonuclease n=1 Tax=Glaciihabitans sp. dw_435 TaxID=2720081 RepID=UPI001BD51DBF
GKPGSEIDHIAGSTGELENLQLLCGDCHRAKTSTHLVPASTDQAALLQSLMLNRVAPEAPRLLADDDANWQDAWRGLKAARRRRFIDKLESEGVDLHGLKTRADMVLAREDAMDDWSSGPVFMLDDDGGYGPSSYFARLTRSDD